jgi:hypothetical protein
MAKYTFSVYFITLNDSIVAALATLALFEQDLAEQVAALLYPSTII